MLTMAARHQKWDDLLKELKAIKRQNDIIWCKFLLEKCTSRLTRRSSSKCVPSYAMKHVKASVMAVVLDAAGCETWNLA